MSKNFHRRRVSFSEDTGDDLGEDSGRRVPPPVCTSSVPTVSVSSPTASPVAATGQIPFMNYLQVRFRAELMLVFHANHRKSQLASIAAGFTMYYV